MKKFIALGTTVITWVVLIFWLTSQYLYNVIDLDSQKIFEDFPLFHLSSFIIGVFGGILFFRYNSFMIKINFFKLFIALLLISVILISIHFFFGMKENIGLYAPIFLLLIIIFVIDRTFFSVLFANKIANFLGEISYNIYIFQYPVYISSKIIADKFQIKTDSLFFLFSFIFLLILFSIFTHKFIEIKIRKLILERITK
jgi:peptidoglycan/LPS O-acetylase OafA/YrhL